MRSLAGGTRPERYYTHPDAFPMLLLPWWLESTIRGSPDTTFHGDVIYSTINGYYFVRMIDNLMDRENAPDARTLPAMIVLHTQFQQAYRRHLPPDDPFWQDLATVSAESAEMASRDAGQDRITRGRFVSISARKVAGARVPISAVCHRYRRTELLGPWASLVEALGRWHQMRNDMLGWSRDLAAGRPSWFLSEAVRSVGPGGSVPGWVMARGIAWGRGQLDAWMDDLVQAAEGLGSPPLLDYLALRRASNDADWAALQPSLDTIRTLAAR
jgi:hypothetical protein